MQPMQPYQKRARARGVTPATATHGTPDRGGVDEMATPILTPEEEQARMALVHQRLAESDDLTRCEQSLDDLKEILTYWRRFEQQVECQRYEFPLERYRALRRHLKRVRRAVKCFRYHHLVLQEINLQRASMTADEPAVEAQP
jgi:hypothetical protein